MLFAFKNAVAPMDAFEYYVDGFCSPWAMNRR